MEGTLPKVEFGEPDIDSIIEPLLELYLDGRLGLWGMATAGVPYDDPDLDTLESRLDDW